MSAITRNYGILRTPPGLFSTFVANKSTYPIDPWVALAWPLGHPWVPLGHPRATQTQSQSAEGRNSVNVARRKSPRNKLSSSPPRASGGMPGVERSRSGKAVPLLGFANCQLLIANCFFSKSFCRSHPWAPPDYSCFLRPNQLRIRTCPIPRDTKLRKWRAPCRPAALKKPRRAKSRRNKSHPE